MFGLKRSQRSLWLSSLTSATASTSHYPTSTTTKQRRRLEYVQRCVWGVVGIICCSLSLKFNIFQLFCITKIPSLWLLVIPMLLIFSTSHYFTPHRLMHWNKCKEYTFTSASRQSLLWYHKLGDISDLVRKTLFHPDAFIYALYF